VTEFISRWPDRGDAKLGMAHGPGQLHFTLSTLMANRRNASARVGRGLGCSAIQASMAAINGGCSRSPDPTKVAQMVEVLNGLTARDALCLLVGCMLTVLDEGPSDEERQQSLGRCIDLLKGAPVGLTH
jgi:hypothetical protein